MTYALPKFGKLCEERLPPSPMKWKFLTMGFSEHNGTTMCLLGRNKGWGTVPHKPWQIIRSKNLNSTRSQNYNFWMRITSCLTAADSHPLSKRRPQSLSKKAVLRVISEQICLSSISGIISLSAFPPCSMRKHLLRLESGRLRTLLSFESTAKVLFALLEAFSGNKNHHCKTPFLYHSVATVSKHLSEWH